MYRVLIIDDEYLYREALKSTIPWQSLGCQVIGEAENGKQGLEKIVSLKPDIIIADINMPQMDGLSMVKEIKNLSLDSSIIMLTGFAELDYARTAIKYGVDSFCLKPIDDDEIISEIDRILNKRKLRLNLPKIDHSLNTKLSKKFIDISDFMNGLLTQNEMLKETYILDHLGQRGLRIKTYKLLISLQLSSSLDQIDCKKVTIGLLHRYRELLNRDIEIISWSSESNRIDFLCSSDNENNLTKMKLKNFFLKEIELFKETYRVEAILGVSKVFLEMPQLLDSYNEVNNCLRECFFDADQTIVFSRDVTYSLGIIDKDILESKLLSLFHEVRCRNIEGIAMSL
jgi:YesN/AraC family two-component response regulator